MKDEESKHWHSGEITEQMQGYLEVSQYPFETRQADK